MRSQHTRNPDAEQAERTDDFDETWADITWAGNVPEVSPAWTDAHRDEIRLVDVRTPHELKGELGRIPDVENVPLDTLTTDAAAWEPTDKLVLLCRSGGRSGRAANILREAGFIRVASMAGGMIRWNDEGRPSTAN